jgi:NAD(P)-dependent dehydrogenase (short-subunit alcohol dehydrogenase family)
MGEATTGVLAGKSALVTGGAGGIGSACAARLARDGAAVTLMGRSEASLEAAAQKLRAAIPDAKVSIHSGDANRDEDVRAAVARAVSDHGRLDIVVATVGGGGGGGLMTGQSGDEFMAKVSANLRPSFLAIREAAPAMPEGGAFVFISSTAAIMSFRGLGGYCAGKAALDHMVRVAADEMGAKGFRFNAVRPGVTRTPQATGLFANEALMGQFRERTPLGRPGEPEEIAEAVRYLAGPESAWTTGQSIAVDGGNELRGAPRFA